MVNAPRSIGPLPLLPGSLSEIPNAGAFRFTRGMRLPFIGWSRDAGGLTLLNQTLQTSSRSVIACWKVVRKTSPSLTTLRTFCAHHSAGNKKAALGRRLRCQCWTDWFCNRGDRIRTCDILLPKRLSALVGNGFLNLDPSYELVFVLSGVSWCDQVLDIFRTPFAQY